MTCVQPVRLFKNLDPSKYPEGLLVPCGKCIACRIKKRQEWSIRMLHELEAHDNSIFITLTYSDDYIPDRGSLDKKELQKFFKRLRRQLDVKKRKIRYFACGEYGDNTNRPHYHSIIFGMQLKDEDKNYIKDSWKNGMVHFGIAEPDSIRYVAQYIDKKFTGDKANVEYNQKGREPVFRIMSLGLGREYIKNNSEQLIENKKLTHKGVPMSLPRYYIEKLGMSGVDFESHAIESDIKIVEHYTGEKITDKELYRKASAEDYIKYDKARKRAKAQHKINLEAKVAIKVSKL